nr:hypothetical protein BaRGS_034208 [Batillaria attramentaria]
MLMYTGLHTHISGICLNFHRFMNDPEILKTVYGKYGQTIETPPTLKDLLFGLPWADTGVTRYFIRNKQRVISFAVTIVLQKYDKMFIDALRQKLESAFPETQLNVNNSKIEMVKSQFGLAISAVVTVVSSLIMSLSLCFFFGLNPTLNGSEIFPYLVMIIGLENVLVITKSVVSTPVHLDVKIRVAQGLSKEGWYITKNLCTELFIIFIGFFTFVPAIQEFCLFALVGLWTDFFLQMFFLPPFCPWIFVVWSWQICIARLSRPQAFSQMKVCTVIWILLILYKTGLVEQLANLEDTSISPHSGPQPHHAWNDQSLTERLLERGEEDGIPVTGLGMGYVSILPSIHLSIEIDAETAKKMRHPSESQGYVAPSQPYPTGTGDSGHPHTPTEDKQNVWSHPGGTPQSPYYMYDPEQLKAFYPKSHREFFITVCLCVLSVIVISYFMSVLYKCMCSRNYSRWRHSWARHYARRQRVKGAYYKQIKESVPLLLRGHNQEVECVAVDGQFIVSCCYGGQLRMWDSNTGECISVMQRHRRRKPCLGRNIEDSDADLYAEYHGGKMTPESTSSSEGSLIERTRAFERRIERNRQAMERYSEFTPDLTSTINTDFASMEPQSDSVGSQGDNPFAGDDSELDPASPVWCLTVKDGLIVAGCGNGRIEVFRLEDCICLYTTFYGHEGDGSVRMWDLVTGTCTHKFQWHEGAVAQLATSLQFVVSVGQDDLVCVWERTRSQLLHKLSMELLGGSIILMAHNLGVLGVQGKLELWDLSRGELVRQVSLQDGDQAFVTHMLTLGSNSLVCASGSDLRVIAFPTTLEKAE